MGKSRQTLQLGVGQRKYFVFQLSLGNSKERLVLSVVCTCQYYKEECIGIL